MIESYRVRSADGQVLAADFDRAAAVARVVSEAREYGWAVPLDLVIWSMDEKSRWRVDAVLSIEEKGERLIKVGQEGGS